MMGWDTFVQHLNFMVDAYFYMYIYISDLQRITIMNISNKQYKKRCS